MRKILFVFAAILALGYYSSAQMFDPVHWDQEVKSLGNNEYELIFKAKLDQGWAIYSQTSDPNAAQPTEVTFKKGNHYSLIGKVEERGKKKEGPEPLFDNLVVAKYMDHVDFVQKVKVTDPSKTIDGEVYYMSCNSERCIPPSPKAMSFKIGGGDKGIGTTTVANESDQAVVGSTNHAENAMEASASPMLNSTNSSPSPGILDPVKTTVSVEKKSEKIHSLKINAKMENGWHIYSNKIGEDGPIPSSVDWEPGGHYKLVGELNEVSDHRIEGYDEIFEMKLIKYKESVDFVQDIEIIDPSKPVKGGFTYQTCDASKCLPPKTIAFTYHPNDGKLEFDGMAGSTGAVPPLDFTGDVVDQTNPNLRASLLNPLGNCGEELIKGTNHFWTFIFGFLGGLLALLTPCVFPMIPLTVSYFTKESKKKALSNALIYGLSIIVIYVTIGLLITALFGATALNELATNWIANLIFFLIFVVFAFSFFGYFEITLPSSWTTKTDSMADSGGYIGIFFMAFTLALVSFSCTGPIVGSALVQSASSTIGPFLVMLGFSMALAIPFGLFAAFPAWLNSLPKSGSWMSSVKVVLGFLELALALKFLSNADMARKWNILGYEVFMGLWVIIFALMTIYLFGWIKFPHDSPLKKLTSTRWFFALASLATTVYLATGFIYKKDVNSYKSLNLMSGIAPPSTYNYFLPPPQVNPELKSRFMSFTKCANNLDCFKDYYEGLTYAKEMNKPILLDYTGIFCQNCRRTEDRIWVADKVRNMIESKYVLVSLYCDDPKQLEKEILSKNRNTLLRTVGNKWADHQILNFEQNSQPLYILLTPEEQILAKPRGYRDGIDDYATFLQCGLDAFDKSKGMSVQ
jgi:thiol:disulfide interchange protein